MRFLSKYFLLFKVFYLKLPGHASNPGSGVSGGFSVTP